LRICDDDIDISPIRKKGVQLDPFFVGRVGARLFKILALPQSAFARFDQHAAQLQIPKAAQSEAQGLAPPRPANPRWQLRPRLEAGRPSLNSISMGLLLASGQIAAGEAVVG